MRVTVVFPDNVINVDGVAKSIPVAPSDPNHRVIQWNGESGVIEVNQGDRIWLDDIAVIQPFIDRWTESEQLV